MILDTLRLGLALMLWATIPAGITYWLLIHGFVRYWRRVGVVRTYMVVLPLCLLVAGAFLRWGFPFVERTDLGTRMGLFTAGVVLWGLSVYLDRRARQVLDFRTMIGIVELGGRAGFPEGTLGAVDEPTRDPVLLDEGLYARVRHPRYLSLLLGAAGWALMANHGAGYLMAAALLPAVLLITEVEERELLERFGDRYADYRTRVPRLLPLRGSSAEGA